MNDLNEISSSINEHQLSVNEHKDKIKKLFDEIMLGLVESKNVITKEIENKYKEIDSTFNKKSKHEQSILELKRTIFKVLQVE